MMGVVSPFDVLNGKTSVRGLETVATNTQALLADKAVQIPTSSAPINLLAPEVKSVAPSQSVSTSAATTQANIDSSGTAPIIPTPGNTVTTTPLPELKITSVEISDWNTANYAAPNTDLLLAQTTSTTGTVIPAFDPTKACGPNNLPSNALQVQAAANATANGLNWGNIPNAAPIPGQQESQGTPVTFNKNVSGPGSSIWQKDLMQERLNTVLPRSAANITNPQEYKFSDGRGEIAYIKLLTSNVSGVKSRNSIDSLKPDINDMLGANDTGYRKFFLTDVNMSYTEQMQIHKTFGDGEVVYFFGKQPMVFSFSGLLFDSLEEDWFTKFITLYGNYLRGTQLAKNFELVQLVLPNVRMKGYITSLSHVQNSSNDQTIQFNFQFLAKEVVPTPISKADANIKNLKYKMLNWKAGKDGKDPNYKPSKLSISGQNQPKKSTTSKRWGVGGYQSPALSKIQTTADNTTNKLDSVTKKIDAFNQSLFTPVYGIISSISKTLESVGATTKSLNATANAGLSTLQNVTDVAQKAEGIVSTVEGLVKDIVSIPGRGAKQLGKTLKALKGAAGTISNIPEDLSQILKRAMNSVKLGPNSAVLKATNNRPARRKYSLSQGTPYSPKTSNKL